VDIIWLIAGGCVAGYFAALPVLLSSEVAYGVGKTNPRRARLDIVAGAGVLCGAIYVWLRHSQDSIGEYGASHAFDFALAAAFVATLVWRALARGRQEAVAADSADSDVVAAYSECLQVHPVGFKSETLLPYPRERIQAAIHALAPVATTEDDRRALRVCLEALKDYVPAAQIPGDPEQAALAWLKSRAGTGAGAAPIREAARLRLIIGGRK
jgi:hypothetical protein